MTELEYMVSKGKIHDSYGICGAARVCKYGVDNCKNVLCSQCEFNGNVHLCLEVLLAEHKEKIKLTRAEKTILESIDKEYKWIIRESTGNLYIYANEPYKGLCWYGVGNAIFTVFNHLFQFIKWEDDEPYNIQELLENCEVEER